MSSIVTAVRRSLYLVLLAGAVGGAYAWWRDRQQSSLAPAEWPPLDPSARADRAPTAPDPDEAAPPTIVPSTPAPDAVPADEDAAPPATAASFVNALVDAPEARSSDGTAGGWVDPLDDGSCPIDHPIKANDNSGIFHVPDGRFYERTKAERCYSSDEAAAADGYRRAKH